MACGSSTDHRQTPAQPLVTSQTMVVLWGALVHKVNRSSSWPPMLPRAGAIPRPGGMFRGWVWVFINSRLLIPPLPLQSLSQWMHLSISPSFSPLQNVFAHPTGTAGWLPSPALQGGEATNHFLQEKMIQLVSWFPKFHLVDWFYCFRSGARSGIMVVRAWWGRAAHFSVVKKQTTQRKEVGDTLLKGPSHLLPPGRRCLLKFLCL